MRVCVYAQTHAFRMCACMRVLTHRHTPFECVCVCAYTQTHAFGMCTRMRLRTDKRLWNMCAYACTHGHMHSIVCYRSTLYLIRVRVRQLMHVYLKFPNTLPFIPHTCPLLFCSMLTSLNLLLAT